MENNIKFNLIIEKLNKKIANLNIKLSKDSNNIELQNELNTLLNDRNIIYSGNASDFEELIKKYGDLING